MRFVKHLGLLQRWSHTTILTFLLLCSVGVNVLLARKTKTLQNTLDTISSGKKILPGSTVPPLQAKTLAGLPVILSYGDSKSPTVIYVFSTSCSWCDRNVDNINFLATNMKNGYRFLGLSIDRDLSKLDEYITKNNFPFPIYHSPTALMWADYKLGGTPMTIVISPEGKVIDDWSGAYAQGTREYIEAFFKIRLPGIKPVSNERSLETIQ